MRTIIIGTSSKKTQLFNIVISVFVPIFWEGNFPSKWLRNVITSIITIQI